jgi:hypothetical protein
MRVTPGVTPRNGRWGFGEPTVPSHRPALESHGRRPQWREMPVHLMPTIMLKAWPLGCFGSKSIVLREHGRRSKVVIGSIDHVHTKPPVSIAVPLRRWRQTS